MRTTATFFLLLLLVNAGWSQLALELATEGYGEAVELTFRNKSDGETEIEIPGEMAVGSEKYFRLEAVRSDGRPVKDQPLFWDAAPPLVIRMPSGAVFRRTLWPRSYVDVAVVYDLLKLRVTYRNPLDGKSVTSNWLELNKNRERYGDEWGSYSLAEFPNNASKPCIVVCEHGDNLPQFLQPVVAIWEDGVFLMWPHANDFTLIGKYDTSDLRGSLEAIRETGFLDGEDGGLVVPDAGHTEIYVRHGDRERRVGWHGSLNPGFGGNINRDPEYRTFVRRWLKTRAAIGALAPIAIHRYVESRGQSPAPTFRGYMFRAPGKTKWLRPE